MNRSRIHSSPDLTPCSSEDDYDDSALEGVAANVKLLLKLIQDNKEACKRQKNDGRRMLRVATMMTILDNVRNRIQKCQFGNKKSEGEIRQCNTNPKPIQSPGENKQGGELVDDEQENLRKALNASLTARKNLEMMCSSLGKEKEIMTAELSKKVHELNEMEELINDLKAQNETLLEKVKECASEHGDKTFGPVIGAEIHGHAAIQERNRALSEHLLRSLDGYRSLKRKLKEALEENLVARSTIEEMVMKVRASIERFRGFKEHIASGSDPSVDIEEEISRLEHAFECLHMQVTKNGPKRGECMKPKNKMINTSTASVLV